jgi:hypothetical protein
LSPTCGHNDRVSNRAHAPARPSATGVSSTRCLCNALHSSTTNANDAGDLQYAMTGSQFLTNALLDLFLDARTADRLTTLGPMQLGARKPALTRATIMARSNSLKTPSMPNMARPAGVVVSNPCWWMNRSTLAPRSSCIDPTRSGSDRPKRSTAQTITRPWPEQVSRSRLRVRLQPRPHRAAGADSPANMQWQRRQDAREQGRTRVGSGRPSGKLLG